MKDKRPRQADWKRLGLAVQSARTRLGWPDMADWADVTERSTRLLQGLERGEHTGAGTLRVIENTLGWRPGYCDVILTDPNADLAPETAKPERGEYEWDDDPRPLDQYTTAELLEEVNTRYLELASQLQTATGRSLVTSRDEGLGEIVEALSPQRQRAAGGR